MPPGMDSDVARIKWEAKIEAKVVTNAGSIIEHKETLKKVEKLITKVEVLEVKVKIYVAIAVFVVTPITTIIVSAIMGS